MKSGIFYLVIFFSLISFAQKRNFTLDDIYKVKNVGAPALSNDGSKLVFAVTSYDMQKGKSKTEIFLMNSDGKNLKQLQIKEGNPYSPFWGKDNNYVFYFKYIDGESNLLKYDLQNDSSISVLKYYPGIDELQISNDGSKTIFSSKVYPDCGADEECNKENIEAAEENPLQAYLADELLYRHWTSFDEGKYSHLILKKFEEEKFVDLTPGNFHSPIFSLGGVGFNFSHDDLKIAFVSNREKDQASTTNADVWLLDLTSNEIENITTQNKAWDGSPIFSPDGKYLAYLKQDRPGFESDIFTIVLYDLKTKTHRNISSNFDNAINEIQWSPDSKQIYFTADVQGYSPLYRIDVQSQNIEKISNNVAIGGYTIAPNGKSIFYTYRLMNKPAEIYKFDFDSKKETQLTFYNKELLEAVDFRPVEQLWITGADNKPVHMLLVKPHNFDPQKKYPLVINVHGGPQGQWMDAYRGDGQLYAGYGYVTAFPNPHGSRGYGQAYTDQISGNWGGNVFEDIICVRDSLSKLSFIDTNRIGAMGWSYGGYMMNWLQAKAPEKFKCFVSMMGIYNLESFYGTTEELWFPEWDLKGQPWNSDDYKKFSPSNFVSNFSTPTLIITGERDYRVSYTQSVEYFTALQKKGIDSRLIIFKNDGHWPNHYRSMPLYYNSHLEWFNKYLGGEPAPYDSKQMIRNKAF